jgi:hypothetical protein
MKDEDKEYVRAFAAMFAMNGLLTRGEWGNLMRESFRLADSFMDELESQDTTGIASIKPKKKYDRKA